MLTIGKKSGGSSSSVGEKMGIIIRGINAVKRDVLPSFLPPKIMHNYIDLLAGPPKQGSHSSWHLCVPTYASDFIRVEGKHWQLDTTIRGEILLHYCQTPCFSDSLPTRSTKPSSQVCLIRKLQLLGRGIQEQGCTRPPLAGLTLATLLLPIPLFCTY